MSTFRVAGFLVPILAGVVASGCATGAPDRERAPASDASACSLLSTYARRLALVDPSFFASASPEELVAVEALIVDLVRSTSVTKAPFTLYHWAPASQVQSKIPVKIRDDAGYRYFRAKVDRFAINHNLGSVAGNGLYCSTDPVATVNFGGSAPLLVTVRMNTGARTIDMRTFTLRDQTSSALEAVGCDYRDFVSVMQGNSSCAKYFKLAMLALEIDAVEYDYSTLLDCESRHSAFVVIRSQGFDRQDVSLLVPAATDLADPETRAAAQLVYRLSEHQWGSSSAFSAWASGFGDESSAYRPGTSAYEKLRNENVLSCPKVADHLVPLGAWTPKQGKPVARKTEAGLAAHEKIAATTGLQAVYCGAKLIRMVSVEIGTSGAGGLHSDPGMLDAFRNFCDGAPSCTYGVSYIDSLSDAKEGAGAMLRAKWECIGSSGKPEAHAKDFPVPQYSTIELDCSDDTATR